MKQLLCFSLCWLGLTSDCPALDRPNIVLIMADDLGYETIGCYGGTSYGTPHIDQLAAEGIRFERAYAMPLCTNTRIQLMTGKYNVRNWRAFGILDRDERTFGHLLKEVGYKTCIAGKWQLTSYDPPDYPGAEKRRGKGMHPRDSGFDEYSLWHVGHTEDKGSRYADPVIEQNGKMLSATKGKYGPDVWTDFIGDFMRRHRDGPFFVYYSMALPHNPMTPTPDSPEWQDPAKRANDETRFAADMIRYTDKMVGKVVAQLDDLGLRDNTLVLFFSDNGTNLRVRSKLGDTIVRGGKGKANELGIRVPAFANWKGTIRAGTILRDLIDSTDFLPTMLDVAGASDQIPAGIDGVSFAAQLHGRPGNPRSAIYIHQDPRPGWDKDRFGLIRLAIDRRYKLYEDGRLFDLISDRFEQTPLYLAQDSAASRAARVKLQRVLDSMKPYSLFDPAQVPRPNPLDFYKDYAFQDDGGYVVIEAELLRVPRDESWLVENQISGFTGTGYLRSLRDQSQRPTHGATLVSAALATDGPWQIAVRCRTDHVSGSAENDFWIKVADREWMSTECTKASFGKWSWVIIDAAADAREQNGGATERDNSIWIAPRSANLKIDRIVFFQADQRNKAMDRATAMSSYHPWVSR